MSTANSPGSQSRAPAGLNLDQPATPRLAATVVVARPTATGDGLELFMLRRSARSKFMPDAMVFPGGKLDPGDGPAGSDEAFEAAARRECEEESGIVLGGRPVRWFDTWLTPSVEQRRYLARFYLAQLQRHEGDDAAADGHETHDGRWARAEEFLDDCARGAIDLPPPTICTLLRMREPSWLRELASAPAYSPAQLRTPILPKWWYVEGSIEGSDEPAHHHVFLPHDPEYPAIQGESAALPERARPLPPRFVRVGNTWRVP
ncbi:MAG: NUDIX hydrolase [Myxococcales bacterium]|nr:NUDIX hydrolase [Myxococcales bacterium]